MYHILINKLFNIAVVASKKKTSTDKKRQGKRIHNERQNTIILRTWAHTKYIEWILLYSLIFISVFVSPSPSLGTFCISLACLHSTLTKVHRTHVTRRTARMLLSGLNTYHGTFSRNYCYHRLLIVNASFIILILLFCYSLIFLFKSAQRRRCKLPQ